MPIANHIGDISMDKYASGVYYYWINAIGNDGQKFVTVSRFALLGQRK